MGNKQIKHKNSVKTSKSQILEEGEEEEFFDDNAPVKKKTKTYLTGLEHNPLISQVKSSLSEDYTLIIELGTGSFATVHLVKHKKQ